MDLPFSYFPILQPNTSPPPLGVLGLTACSSWPILTGNLCMSSRSEAIPQFIQRYTYVLIPNEGRHRATCAR